MTAMPVGYRECSDIDMAQRQRNVPPLAVQVAIVIVKVIIVALTKIVVVVVLVETRTPRGGGATGR